MDAKVLNLLEHLESYPYSQQVNIADFINENFSLIPTQDMYTFNQKRLPVIHFLRKLKTDGYVDYLYEDRLDEVNDFRSNPTKWINYTFEVWLTEFGRNELKKERDRKLNEDVSLSAISVNDSIIATNKAIQEMDKRMLEHAERQEAIMLQQSGFTEQQVTFTERQVTLIEQQLTLIRTQNNLYRNILIIAGINILIGIIILVITIISGSEKKLISTQQLQLTEQRKEIKRLKLLKSDTVHYVLHYPLLKSTLKKK